MRNMMRIVSIVHPGVSTYTHTARTLKHTHATHFHRYFQIQKKLFEINTQMLREKRKTKIIKMCRHPMDTELGIKNDDGLYVAAVWRV